MESWKAMLFLAVVTVVTSLSLAQGMRDEDYIKEVVELYNENADNLYKPLHDYPARFVLVEEDSQLLVFLIKETQCDKSENATILDCDFKPNGEIKVCTSYLDEQKNPDNITCNGLPQKSRTRRSANRKRCKNAVCKLLGKLKGSGSPIAGARNRQRPPFSATYV
ncbi:cathelicidin-related antimicrobial peptide Na_CRAMP-like isoform 3-T3 [Discoglossus pictus]